MTRVLGDVLGVEEARAFLPAGCCDVSRGLIRSAAAVIVAFVRERCGETEMTEEARKEAQFGARFGARSSSFEAGPTTIRTKIGASIGARAICGSMNQEHRNADAVGFC